MYNVDLTVKDLSGFLFSITGDNQPVDDTSAQDETIEVERLAIQGMYDESVGLADTIAKWLVDDKRNPPMQKGECFRCGDIVAADSLIEVLEDNGNFRLCGDCFVKLPRTAKRRSSTDTEPSATISRKDFTELLQDRDIVKKLGIVKGYGDTNPILKETFVSDVACTPLFNIYNLTLPTVTATVTVKETYPCLCNIDTQGNGNPCPDVDADGNHTKETVVSLVDVLAILGIDIDKSAFDIASFIAAYQKQNDGEAARVPF